MTRPALALVLALLAAAAPPACAAPRPVADPAALPRGSAPGGSVMQIGACEATLLAPGFHRAEKPPADLVQAWRFSRGAGQTVAVIDTGAQPSPRLRVLPGGDYVQATDGLVDCDGHGTLVAGIIGAQPGEDGFSGVAPDARLISIRQTSAKFSQRAPDEDPAVGGLARAVQTLARAVMRAADLGASVINVSVPICVSAAKPVDQAALGAALRYAAVDKDAVVVAASGDIDGSGPNCRANPLSGPGADPRNWSGAASISTPSWWQPYVLSVGSVASDGSPSRFTMPGPWVGASARGESVTSLSNRPDGGLANAVLGQDGKPVPINGTGFAAAYVSGVAALVRSRFPELTSSQTVARLERTVRDAGRSPSNLVGVGSVDPVAALTWELPADGSPAGPSARAVAAPSAPKPEDPLPRRLAFAGSGICLIAVIAAGAAAARRRQESAE